MGNCALEPRLSGYGVIWQYRDPWTSTESNPIWITWLGTKDLKSPKFSRAADIDMTENDGSGWETSKPSPLKKIENVPIEGNLLQEQYDKLWLMYEDDIVTDWRQVLQQVATEPYVQFCGYVLDMENDYPMRDLAKMRFTLKPVGKPDKGELSPTS